MKKLYCIACPLGCELEIDVSKDPMVIHGNKCPRGEDFAIAETLNPTRVLTTTVRTVFPDVPVISVRTAGEIPRDLLLPAMQALNDVLVDRVLSCGDVVVEDLLGTGVPVVITGSILEQLGSR